MYQLIMDLVETLAKEFPDSNLDLVTLEEKIIKYTENVNDIKVEPVLEWKKGEYIFRIVGHNLVFIDQFFRYVAEDKLKQDTYSKNNTVFLYFTNKIYHTLIKMPGLKNKKIIRDAAWEMKMYAAGCEPYDDTKKVVLEAGCIILPTIRKEKIGKGFFDISEDKKFIKEYNSKKGQTIKGSRKLRKKYIEKYGASNIFR